MPEMPEMQALAERLDDAIAGAILLRAIPMGFSALKTVLPSPSEVTGRAVEGVGRKGKFLVFLLAGGTRLLVHLSQAGRVDLESPPKATRGKGAVARFLFDNSRAILVREHGTERRAGWWLLATGDDGPLAALGPDPFDAGFGERVLGTDDNRHLHTILRDQRFVAGIGRGYTDDALNRAGLSPFASLRTLRSEDRIHLVSSVRSVLEEALGRERLRKGALSEARLGERFEVHGRSGRPCPRCGEALRRVSYESHETTYCKTCQTGGRMLADRRLSRLIR